ncbi:MAG: tRNA (adenosine(37)-N6)-threonylcarbamoyltransferase complex dimerization subunit type 1 TsaB [Candidatus Izemoplasmatales bacterium]|jgi:tRNA threonylcarbamoyladenosine biosynthesis protein TsaB|nr:tRNA (adenosine(37)-N6)-threonylcarbamoyltransferase complex dimerization subunit type 1 TsaB [Candidatus Izemoplasmatales bacterium]MDD3865454.1 tRNA (adenosine(37)-N6)-threonylcarbamoyltransferase complex dimerization subunit type 1 TsaB [Candidatus Izemoplasmatales bacterium]
MPQLSKTLVIDTATDYVFLSLVVEGSEIGYKYQNDLHNHAVTVMPMLDELLKKAQITLKDVNEIIVGIGPGSYTGVRIGVTIAKMIGYLNNISVKTVSTLALLASSSSAAKTMAMIDARRGNAFVACYQQEKGIMKETVADTLTNIEQFKQTLTIDTEIIRVGKPNVEKIMQSNLMKPVKNIHELVPNYLQVTEAERNKGKI